MDTNNTNTSYLLDLSDEAMSHTHYKIETPIPGHWFKDLDGNPLWINPSIMITWKAKSDKL